MLPHPSHPGRGLEHILNPLAVAVIGTSENPARFGGRVMNYIECGDARGAGCAILSADFAAAGNAGAARQDELVNIARARGMRLKGPHCLGFINPGLKLALTSSVAIAAEPMPAGPRRARQPTRRADGVADIACKGPRNGLKRHGISRQSSRP